MINKQDIIISKKFFKMVLNHDFFKNKKKENPEYKDVQKVGDDMYYLFNQKHEVCVMPAEDFMGALHDTNELARILANNKN